MPQQCNFCPLLVKTGKIEHLSYFVFWLIRIKSPEALVMRANVSDEPRDERYTVLLLTVVSLQGCVCCHCPK